MLYEAPLRGLGDAAAAVATASLLLDLTAPASRFAPEAVLGLQALLEQTFAFPARSSVVVPRAFFGRCVVPTLPALAAGLEEGVSLPWMEWWPRGVLSWAEEGGAQPGSGKEPAVRDAAQLRLAWLSLSAGPAALVPSVTKCHALLRCVLALIERVVAAAASLPAADVLFQGMEEALEHIIAALGGEDESEEAGVTTTDTSGSSRANHEDDNDNNSNAHPLLPAIRSALRAVRGVSEATMRSREPLRLRS